MIRLESKFNIGDVVRVYSRITQYNVPCPICKGIYIRKNPAYNEQDGYDNKRMLVCGVCRNGSVANKKKDRGILGQTEWIIDSIHFNIDSDGKVSTVYVLENTNTTISVEYEEDIVLVKSSSYFK